MGGLRYDDNNDVGVDSEGNYYIKKATLVVYEKTIQNNTMSGRTAADRAIQLAEIFFALSSLQIYGIK